VCCARSGTPDNHVKLHPNVGAQLAKEAAAAIARRTAESVKVGDPLDPATARRRWLREARAPACNEGGYAYQEI
jgi:hypothetical protein